MASAMTATEPTESTNHFLGMASETRLNVYGLLFIHPEPIVLEVASDGRFKGVNVSQVDFPLNLLSTCWQIHTEASPIVYQGNKYIIPWQTLSVPISPQQCVSDLLRMIEIDCTSGGAWGFAQAIKTLTGRAHGLREITLTFQRSARFMTAALELSNALPGCASVFEMPILQATVSPLKRDDLVKKDDDSEHIADIQASLRKSNLLSDLLAFGAPHATELTTSPETSSLSGSDLSIIKLNGKVSRYLKTTFERHRCSTGSCAFVKDWEETLRQDDDADTTPNRYRYTWKKVGAPTPEIDANMRQWQPELPDKYKMMLVEFMLSLGMTIDEVIHIISRAEFTAMDNSESTSGSDTVQDEAEPSIEPGDLPNVWVEQNSMLPEIAAMYDNLQDPSTVHASLAETYEPDFSHGEGAGGDQDQAGEEEDDMLGLAALALSEPQSDGPGGSAQHSGVLQVTANVTTPEQHSGMDATPGPNAHPWAFGHRSTAPDQTSSKTPDYMGCDFDEAEMARLQRRVTPNLERIQEWVAEQRKNHEERTSKPASASATP